MYSNPKNDPDALIAARRLELALKWREDWRREMAGAARQTPPPPRSKSHSFSTALAQAEFGRFYFDSQRYCQALDRGGVIWTERKPLRNPQRQKP